MYVSEICAEGINCVFSLVTKNVKSRSKIALKNERRFEIWFPKKKTITFFRKKTIWTTQKRPNFACNIYIFPKIRANKNKQWTHLGALITFSWGYLKSHSTKRIVWTHFNAVLWFYFSLRAIGPVNILILKEKMKKKIMYFSSPFCSRHRMEMVKTTSLGPRQTQQDLVWSKNKWLVDLFWGTCANERFFFFFFF